MLNRYFTFSHITLYVALSISAIAAYYSVLGLATIYAGAAIPIMVMGAILEVAKITTTIWLHRYWDRASKIIKTYLTTAVVVLACLTSMGIFGLLSKSHIDSGLQGGDVSAQVAILDEKIKTQRENVEIARRALQQLDAQVNERLARGTTEQSAERSVQIRRQQSTERAKLQREISDAQTAIAKLTEERAPIASQLRKVEAEVGPVKYIAALIYGDNPDAALLERAVRWVTILIVMVFDPLAIVLILAAQNSFAWQRQDREKQKLIDDDTAAMSIRVPDDIQIRPFTEAEMNALNDEQATPEPKEEPKEEPKSELGFGQRFYSSENYVVRPPVINTELKTEDATTSVEQVDSAVSAKPVVEDETVEKVRFTDDQEYVSFEGKITSIRALKVLRPDLVISASQVKLPVINYGGKFPKEAVNGEYYIRTDYRPHVVYRFLNKKWILIDKEENTVYTQSSEYIEFLIKQIERAEYDVQHLTSIEENVISEHLSKS
jgi:hypothetical protein